MYPDLYVDDQCVRFGDAYPKARHHALVVARNPRLDTPSDLRAEDVPLLLHMQVRRTQWRLWKVATSHYCLFVGPRVKSASVSSKCPAMEISTV